MSGLYANAIPDDSCPQNASLRVRGRLLFPLMGWLAL